MIAKKYQWWCVIFLSEMFASIFLLFIGCLSEVDNSPYFKPSILTIAISFGLAVMIGINSFGVTSGGLMTPILTLMLYIYEKFDLKVALIYFLGQITGSFVGYALVRAVIPDDFLLNPTTFCASHPRHSIGSAFVIEFMIAFIFVTFTCAVLHPKNAHYHDSASLKFGLVVFVFVITAGPYSGVGINPARSFAPALYNWHWDNHWLYWTAPFCGTISASVLYKYIFGPSYEDIKDEEPAIQNGSKVEELENNDKV